MVIQAITSSNPMGTISNPMGITAPTETGDSSDRARSSTVNGPLASLPGGLLFDDLACWTASASLPA